MYVPLRDPSNLADAYLFKVSYISRKDQSLAQHGKPLLSDPFSNRWTRSGKNTRENGLAVSSVVSQFSTSRFFYRAESTQFYSADLTSRFVVIASHSRHVRKIFNSPTFVKPCVVDVAHKLFGRVTWSSLTAKRTSTSARVSMACSLAKRSNHICQDRRRSTTHTLRGS